MFSARRGVNRGPQLVSVPLSQRRSTEEVVPSGLSAKTSTVSQRQAAYEAVAAALAIALADAPAARALEVDGLDDPPGVQAARKAAVPLAPIRARTSRRVRIRPISRSSSSSSSIELRSAFAVGAGRVSEGLLGW